MSAYKINEWQSPAGLTEAAFSPPIIDAPSIPPPEEPEYSVPKDSGSTGGIDPKLLLGLLGGQTEQNPTMSMLMNLLGGEKPDMLSLLPLVLPLLQKKEKVPETHPPVPETPPPDIEKPKSLDDYTVIS